VIAVPGQNLNGWPGRLNQLDARKGRSMLTAFVLFIRIIS